MTTPISSNPGAPEDLVELGRIVGAYGIRGWVRVRAYSADSRTLLDARHWWLKKPSAPDLDAGGLSFRAVEIVSCRMHNEAIVAQFADVPDRTHAETLKGYSVWVSRADFASLDSDEYYWVDLIGCRLYGEDNGQSVLIGEVTGVIDNGAHGVLQVTRATENDAGALQYLTDAKGRKIEELVPFVSVHVHTVDLKNKRLISNWPVN